MLVILKEKLFKKSKWIKNCLKNEKQSCRWRDSNPGPLRDLATRFTEVPGLPPLPPATNTVSAMLCFVIRNLYPEVAVDKKYLKVG